MNMVKGTPEKIRGPLLHPNHSKFPGVSGPFRNGTNANHPFPNFMNLVVSIGLMAFFLFATTVQAQGSGSSAADKLMQEGNLLFQQGSFGEAALRWDDAARLYEAAGGNTGTGASFNPPFTGFPAARSE